MNYIKPSVNLNAFTCPNCGVYAKQSWIVFNWDVMRINNGELTRGKCDHCSGHSLWLHANMLFPDNGNAPFPNPQMPENVKKLYLEAASIHMKSPRGAGALLRLGLQILCKELGESGTNINTDIGNLVKKGLPPMVQQALDVVRVVGNDAVHPGQIDTDDPEIVMSLFQLINVIVEYMIALPNHVNGLYSKLPVEKVKGIEDRDKSRS